MEYDLNDRLFQFAVRSLKYAQTLPDGAEYHVIKYQLSKSATSAGANYEESQAGLSRADFSNKIKIALKEMRESGYWLRIIRELDDTQMTNRELAWLIDESEELKKILGAIVQKTKKQ